MLPKSEAALRMPYLKVIGIGRTIRIWRLSATSCGGSFRNSSHGHSHDSLRFWQHFFRILTSGLEQCEYICGSRISSILHFTKGTRNFYSHHYNPPQMGYRWVRADPRITPGWTHPGNSGSGTGNPEKTGKSVSHPFCFITAEPGHLQTW